MKTVAKCIRQAEIAGISPRTWHPPTTVPGPNPDPAPDLVKRRFDQGRRDVAWFSDIVYLATGEGWGYLCTVRDGHTRRVLGRTVVDHCEPTWSRTPYGKPSPCAASCRARSSFTQIEAVSTPASRALTWLASSTCSARWAGPGVLG